MRRWAVVAVAFAAGMLAGRALPARAKCRPNSLDEPIRLVEDRGDLAAASEGRLRATDSGETFYVTVTAGLWIVSVEREEP